MRIWVGKEMEWQNKGLLTMFIEARNLSETNLRTAFLLLTEQEGVQAVYFGAGRTDFKLFHYESFIYILDYCLNNKLKITIETSSLKYILNNPVITELIRLYEIQILVRKDLETETKQLFDILPQIVYKLDNKEVAVFTQAKIQDLTEIGTVVGGLYENVDKLIYTEKEGELK